MSEVTVVEAVQGSCPNQDLTLSIVPQSRRKTEAHSSHPEANTFPVATGFHTEFDLTMSLIAGQLYPQLVCVHMALGTC